MFRSLQLQSRLPAASQHRTCFAARAAVPMCFVTAGCKTRMEGASHQMNHPSRSANSADFFKVMLRPSVFFADFYVKASSRHAWCNFADLVFHKCSFWSANRALATVCFTFCRPYLLKVLRTWQFFKLSLQSSLLSTIFADRAPKLQKQRLSSRDPE